MPDADSSMPAGWIDISAYKQSFEADRRSVPDILLSIAELALNDASALSDLQIRQLCFGAVWHDVLL